MTVQPDPIIAALNAPLPSGETVDGCLAAHDVSAETVIPAALKAAAPLLRAEGAAAERDRIRQLAQQRFDLLAPSDYSAAAGTLADLLIILGEPSCSPQPEAVLQLGGRNPGLYIDGERVFGEDAPAVRRVPQ